MGEHGVACELCEQPGGILLWQNALARVVLVNDADYPGFCRVILNRHLAEMSDLPTAEAHQLLDILLGVERALRHTLSPDKINLASFGNMVPHLHWHLIPRYRDDAHFPQAIWAARQRDTSRPAIDMDALLAAITRELAPGASA